MDTSSVNVNGDSSFPRNVRSPSTSFSPSMWGDFFTSFLLDDQVQENYAKAIETLKDETRRMLMAEGSNNTDKDKLILIDTIERLGLGYHFEQEIENQLQQIFESQSEDYDLFTTALRFRLLRQHRHHVSCRVFDKFKGNDNKFNEILGNNVKGLLSLYEAAHLRIHGEEFLEEALKFTGYHLNRIVQQLEYSPFQDQVKRALHIPLHRGVQRIETRNFISWYEKDDSKNEQLLKLAKLDYNYLQNIYKKELNELCRWWNEFDLKSKLPYARDRVVESYLWGLGFHYEPHYSYVRIAMGKIAQFFSVVDDTYDNYATLQEADLFTEILERWSTDEIDRLPDYMQIVYRFILSIYDDYEHEAVKQEKSFAIPYAIETVKQLSRAYNKELKWFMQGKMPTFEEYVSNSMITSCMYVMLTFTIPGMKSVTKEMIDWLKGQPKIVTAGATIGRCKNDLGHHVAENKEGNNLLAIECYMENHGVSKHEAVDKFVARVEDAWKDLNKEWISETNCIPKDIIEQVLNYARLAEVTYKNFQDAYTEPGKDMVAQMVSLFIDPII